jgi:hypothetical protein
VRSTGQQQEKETRSEEQIRQVELATDVEHEQPANTDEEQKNVDWTHRRSEAISA